jgi:membrane protease YdiL (CAAX protease family)
LGLVVGVAVLPIAWFLSYFSALILTWIGLQPEAQATIQVLQMEISSAHRIYIGISAILLAPVVEELLFRGILYPIIKQRGYPRLALWGTALLFAAIHANLMTFIPLAFFAIILTLLYEATDNLLAPIVSHSLFNAANYFWLISTQTSPTVSPLG